MLRDRSKRFVFGEHGGRRYEQSEHIVLPAEPASARAARRFVQRVIGETIPPEGLDVVALLTTEVVTNAVVHAGTPVDLVVRRSKGCVQIEVSDEVRESPVVAELSPPTCSGLGMNLVSTLAQEWGVVPTAHGKTVWFRCSGL